MSIHEVASTMTLDEALGAGWRCSLSYAPARRCCIERAADWT
ncbi:MAG TPA: hypothetical protein VHF89_11615 [Solirubrobacteraceae bacterium]|nr:hypothetical protein [Solirubrobacteraceae bacterium]